MIEVFHKGGPVMWPLLLASVAVITVAIERLLFLWSVRRDRDPAAVQSMLRLVENGLLDEALKVGESSRDYVARTMGYALANRARSLESALLQAASRELRRFSWGLPVLDTVITLAPLLGLLGTVTGMIGAFGLLGQAELEAPSVITGGIAEALIATAFGLAIAIAALVPFNFLNAKLESARSELEHVASQLELGLAAALNKDQAQAVRQR